MQHIAAALLEFVYSLVVNNIPLYTPPQHSAVSLFLFLKKDDDESKKGVSPHTTHKRYCNGENPRKSQPLHNLMPKYAIQ